MISATTSSPVTYEASQELLEIFFRHGFVDGTRTYYPKHYQRLLTGGYDPGSVKRKLTYKRELKDRILFDYINIEFYVGGCHSSAMTLNEEKLKSVLVYFALAKEDRKNLISSTRKITDLYKEYERLKENSKFGLKLRAAEQRLVDCFESLSI